MNVRREGPSLFCLGGSWASARSGEVVSSLLSNQGDWTSKNKYNKSSLLYAQSFHGVVQRRFSGSRTLYLFCSGGRGHRSAKEALMEKEIYPIYSQIVAQFPLDPNCKDFSSFLAYCLDKKWVLEVDILHDCLGYVGRLFSALWNWALKNSHRKILSLFAILQRWIIDFLCSPILFLHMLWFLQKRRISHIISTQPLGLKAILWAIRVHNDWSKKSSIKPVRLSLYFTDFPSEEAMHFFRPIQHLEKKLGNERLYLYLPCPYPLDLSLRKYVSSIPQQQITLLSLKQLPVRKAFCIPQLFADNPKEHSFFCMLGSSPHLPTLLAYLSLFQQTAIKFKNKKWIIFLYKGQTSSTLLEDHMKKQPPQDRPPNLHVSILEFQPPEQLSVLFQRCHTITRAGGSTMMELLSIESYCERVDRSPRWRDIHTEHGLLETPLWEKENAIIFSRLLKAGQVRLVSPRTYSEIRLEELGKKHSQI